MGISSSKVKTDTQVETQQLDSIRAQIETLSSSKEEFNEWKRVHQIKLDELQKAIEKKDSQKYNELLAEKDAKINDLAKQVE